MSDSVFLSNLHYFLAQTDGTYRFPNSAEGDLLKRAKVEVEALQRENAALRKALYAHADYQRELRADRDRLDWLEVHGEPVTYEDAPHELVWCVIGERGQRSIRAAIDAARAKEAKT